MSLKHHIPNALTCGNLVSGCMSILLVACGMPVKAAVMIFVAGLFDFLDGFAARLLKAHFIMYWLMAHAADLPDFRWLGISVLPCLAFLLPVFSAIRLAKFNIDDTQKTSFRGLPAPGMAIFIASLPLALGQVGHLTDGALGYWACLGITMVFFSFKMKSAKWKGNEVRWIFLIIAVTGLAAFRLVALPFIMMVYVLMSVLFAGKMEQFSENR